MKKIWYFPLEYIEARDYKMFDAEMLKAFSRRSHELNFERIAPDSSSHAIKNGWVMGGASHAKFCSDQASIFLGLIEDGKVKSGDILFFNDFWHFGVEAIQYASHLAGIDLRFFGYIHAGTFTDHDFAQPMHSWARYFEKSLFQIAEKIFVATKKPREDILKHSLSCAKKILVVGHPFDIKVFEEYLEVEKKNRVIFPHRADADKQPEEFIRLARSQKGQREFIMTLGGKSKKDYPKLVRDAEDAGITVFENLKKRDYYKILATCKVMVSTAVQENWGVCTFESLHLNVTPVCPNRCSYPHILPINVLYNTESELGGMVSAFCGSTIDLERYKDKGMSADIMVSEMLA